MNKIIKLIKYYNHYRKQGCGVYASYIHAKFELQMEDYAATFVSLKIQNDITTKEWFS